MSDAQQYLAGLAELGQIEDDTRQRAVWRQAMATLAALAAEQHPVPLEGLRPEALLLGVRAAMQRGLLSELEWLSAPAATAALFELAAALPRSGEKRELGRRVLEAMQHGDATTFVAVATAMAASSGRALSSEPMRARIALALRLPAALGAAVDALALALLSRRELAREWVTGPATGSLPARRLAALLIERAARQAARRARLGDDGALLVFEAGGVPGAWRRLLADREPLVWRHVAAARGSLMAVDGTQAAEVERDLDPALDATQWRRAAASLIASAAFEPEHAIAQARVLFATPRSDRGLAGAAMFGLVAVADAEPEAAQTLAQLLISCGGLSAIEALVEIAGECAAPAFAAARQLAQTHLASRPRATDAGLAALRESLEYELTAASKPGLAGALREALEEFARGGVAAARPATERAVQLAGAAAAALQEAVTIGDEGAAFLALRELDHNVFETAILFDLLAATRAKGEDEANASLAGVFEHVTHCLLERERDPPPAEAQRAVMHRRALRTLLHVIDADGYAAPAEAPRLARRIASWNVLLARAPRESHSRFERTVWAALARTADAMIREELCEVSDVLLVVSDRAARCEQLDILAEASMQPALESSIAALAKLVRAADPMGSALGLRAIADALPAATAARVEALRLALVRTSMALAVLAQAHSLAQLRAVASGRFLAELAEAVSRLARLAMGARRRLGQSTGDAAPRAAAALQRLGWTLERRLRGQVCELPDVAQQALSALRRELPPPFADAIGRDLQRLLELPATVTNASVVQEPTMRSGTGGTARLASWVPPSRIIGGFYLLEPLGGGAVGTVFAARRAEERHDPRAETFALKVPEYVGAVAHTLSEAEFSRMFRQEAGALLALPEHPHLARFITFDAGARPKPILVMELIAGRTLQAALEEQLFTTASAFALLDGVAAGLRAMHAADIAHLDVKPSNVVLRGDALDQPVLVDFGLAGRNLRPGCATLQYGAPEIWSGAVATAPSAADVYAFACVAWEVLTNRVACAGDTPAAVIAAHRRGDVLPTIAGAPPPLTNLARILATALRTDPAARPSIDILRAKLQAEAANWTETSWPLWPPT